VSGSIQADGVGVQFLLDRQQRPVTPHLARFRRHVTEIWGLRDLAFEIGPGEGVALLGPSGAGKTTLLRLIAGVFMPDAGTIDVQGRVASLLSTSGGVVGALTGRENILLLGVLLGLPPAEAKRSSDELRVRSGLGDAFERQLSSYSEGMLARLGLVVAERVEPDILLLDEVHEALDHEFREVLEGLAATVLARGGIVVAAGHDHPLLERVCSRALLIGGGRVLTDGDFRSVQADYLEDHRIEAAGLTG
jgi:ABC-type polysaccharide/polyol phosphate transport system ATPase subunit